MNTYLNFWENYYASHKDPVDESPFSRFVMPFLNEGGTMYELGCGNGRDSIFFSKNGIKVEAFDQCENEIKYLNEKFNSDEMTFSSGDFTDLGKLKSVDSVYSRFTLHSVTKDKEIKTLKWAFDTLNKNGLFFIEIRSIHDELYGQGDQMDDNGYVTDHYRRFVTFNDFVARIESCGFHVLYKIQSKGLAPYKGDDPVIIRVVGQKI